MPLKIDIKPEPRRWSVRVEAQTVALCADLAQAARLAAALGARSPELDEARTDLTAPADLR